MFANLKSLSPQAALLIVQQTRPYVIQVRTRGARVWITYVYEDGKREAMFVGKNRAYDELWKLKKLYPDRQFRALPKPEADRYTAGVQDLLEEIDNEKKQEEVPRRTSRPLRWLPENL